MTTELTSMTADGDRGACMVTPSFIYFDLGKVLLNFSHDQMCRQMADVAGCSEEQVRAAVADGPLLRQLETGQLTTRSFFEAFCEQTKTSPDFDRFVEAASDIFTVNATILPVVGQLEQRGFRLGILSNTSEAHWSHCRRRFRIVRDCFPVAALSYEVGAMKPDGRIFEAAAELAGVSRDEMFFMDDIPANVDGARAAGVDAVVYTTTSALVDELTKRGVGINY